MSELERITPYLPLLSSAEHIELYPPATGLMNEFRFLTSNGTHLKLQNVASGDVVYLAFSMVDFVNPQGGKAIIRLKRKMELKNGGFV